MWGREGHDKFSGGKVKEIYIGEKNMVNKCFRCLKIVVDGKMLKGNKYCKECFDIMKEVLEDE